MFQKIFVGVFLISALFNLSGCANRVGQDVVTSSSSAGKVVFGTVLSYRPVVIKDKEKLSENAVGGLAGGALGGVGGSTIGKGKGKTAATIGGAIAGAVVGAIIEDALTTKSGYEYIVKLDNSQIASASSTYASKTEISLEHSSNTPIQDEIAAAAVPNQSNVDAISVTQDDEYPISAGTRVMIVYRDDGTRITPSM